MTNEEIIKARGVSIHNLLGKQNNGRRILMRCPLPNHRDSTPSFTLYPENNYHCFGCGQTGQGAIDFCMALGYSFQDSVEELIKHL